MEGQRVRYVAAPFRAVMADQRTALVLVDGEGRARRVDRSALRVLQMFAIPLDRDRPLNHRPFWRGQRDLRQTIEMLIVSGLLRPSAAEGERRKQRPRSAPAISTVAITTADRPDALQRCLTSYLRHIGDRGHRVRIVVVDDSRDAICAARNACVTAALDSHDQPIQYVGPDTKRALRSAIVRAGLAPSLVEFALPTAPRGYAAGGNRNAVLLLTAGEVVLSVDDDTIGTVWVPAETRQGLTVCGNGEHLIQRFYTSRAEASPEPWLLGGDLLAAHNSLIGRSLANVVDEAADHCALSEPCTHVIDSLLRGGDRSLVRMTFSALAGDAATYCQHRLLFCRGDVRTALAAGERTYATALKYREVRRGVAQRTVTHHTSCMTYCAAFDNRDMLPPFIPTGFSEDGTFGAVLATCEPAALFGHVPCGIVHDSARPSAYDGRAIKSASQLRLSELLCEIIGWIGRSDFVAARRSRMQRLGEEFVELASLSPEEFAEFVRQRTTEAVCRELAWVDALPAQEFKYPAFWRRDFERFKATLLESIDSPEYFVPIECRVPGDRRAGFGNVQAFVRQFGELLQAWPAMVGAASDLREHRHAEEVV